MKQHHKKKELNKTVYFEEWEYKQAISLIKTNPIEAEKKLREYLTQYPLDYGTYSDYAYVLIILGKFKEAEQVLDYVKKLYKRDNYFNSDSRKVKRLEDRLLFDTLKLWAYQGKYEKLYRFCVNNSGKIDELDMVSLAFYAKIKTGGAAGKLRESYTYRHRQMIEYHEEDFLEHIKKHLADYNINNDDASDVMFVPGFPISKVFEEIKKYVPSEKRLCPGAYDNKYIFKYDGCGRVNNKLVDYFKIVVLHNTDHFITMFPATECENLPYVDLNYLIPEIQDTKVRKLSQIDKFNQRYKRNA